MTSGAAIVANGKETITVDAANDVSSEYVGDAEVLNFAEALSKQNEPKRILSKKIISVDRPLVEESRVAGKIKLLVSNLFFIPLIPCS